MSYNIIGRTPEQEALKQAYESGKSEFVAVFGRRRVGKTFLIKQYFGNRLTFSFSGVSNGNKKLQLDAFHQVMKLSDEVKSQGIKLKKPTSWMEAFANLRMAIEQSDVEERKVIFIDEISWMDTPKSGFLQALEFFWNNWAAWQNNIVLIICGSATSWIVNKVINNYGGLHNRLTRRVHLYPFTLHETELFLKSKKVNWNRKSIAECYMIMGGVPYYLDQIQEKGESLPQAIDRLFFKEGGILRDEFELLFRSLFRNSDKYVKIIRAMSGKRCGYTRTEIIGLTKLPDNGDLSGMLSDLEACGFLKSYQSLMKKDRETYFQLVDFYSLYYLKFVAGQTLNGGTYWQNKRDNNQVVTWLGLSFEMLCLSHVSAIRRKLGIAGVDCEIAKWHSMGDKTKGAQIDLLIKRRDQVTNICEMKFYDTEFEIDSDYADILQNKIQVYKEKTKTKDAIHLTMVTSYGVKKNKHYNLITNEITLDDLFEN